MGTSPLQQQQLDTEALIQKVSTDFAAYEAAVAAFVASVQNSSAAADPGVAAALATLQAVDTTLLTNPGLPTPSAPPAGS